MTQSPRPLRLAAVSATLLAIALLPAPARAQQEKVIGDGRYEYEENCLTCHGNLGRGDGELADILLVRPPDLTQIAKRNGGTFPFWKVFDMIGGEKPVRAHAVSGMPIWASRFRADEQTRFTAPAYVRILLLTHYLESIQEK